MRKVAVGFCCDQHRAQQSERKMHYNHYFPCSFGDMAIVHKKSMVPDKAEDYAFEGIAMYPAENKEGGYYFLNLNTGTVVPRTSYEVIPSYTHQAKKILQNLYEKDMKKAVKLRQLRGDVDPLSTLSFFPIECRYKGSVRVRRSSG